MATIYSSTKGAVDSLTRGLALELGATCLPVTSGRNFAAESPFNRLGRETDIAPVAVFLASDDSAWVTGELIRATWRPDLNQRPILIRRGTRQGYEGLVAKHEASLYGGGVTMR
jgi:NAD(P)-dependent dehydrogenase (short-subunit alcohol dehydrogenase family)